MSTDQEITGAEIILEALKDQVDTIFGYQIAVLQFMMPYLDKIFSNMFDKTGNLRFMQLKVCSFKWKSRRPLVTSGPGVTNVVTGLTDING